MKKTIGAAAALLLATTGATSAADMALKVPPAVGAEIFSWSGFYLGLHAGYGWGSNTWTSHGILEDPALLAVSNFNVRTTGALGGVQAGANYQVESFVVGIEADLSVLHAKGSDDSPVTMAPLFAPTAITSSAISQIEWLALFTGRVGYAFDRTLLYVKGGVAGGGTKDNFTFSSLQMVPGSFIDFGTKNNLQVGGTIGAAVEHAFAPHWSAKIEYDYVDLGKNSENFTIFSNNTSLTVHEDINHRIQIVKVGANYRF